MFFCVNFLVSGCMLCLVCYLFIISTSAIDYPGRFVSEMTYYVSSGTLNLTKPKPNHFSLGRLFWANCYIVDVTDMTCCVIRGVFRLKLSTRHWPNAATALWQSCSMPDWSIDTSLGCRHQAFSTDTVTHRWWIASSHKCRVVNHRRWTTRWSLDQTNWWLPTTVLCWWWQSRRSSWRAHEMKLNAF